MLMIWSTPATKASRTCLFESEYNTKWSCVYF